MKKSTIACYKIATKLNLSRIANYFNLTYQNKISAHLILTAPQISLLIHSEAHVRQVWLFNYGCLCCINFSETESYRLIRSLESFFNNLDFNLALNYNDTHQFNTKTALEDPSTAEIYAIILAKSTELKYLEDSTGAILDQAELLVTELQRGLPNLQSQLLKKISLQSTKLQLGLMRNLKILDRPKACHSSIELHQLYDQLFKEYELAKRFQILQEKIANLLRIITPYQELGYHLREKYLLFLEILLLVLFPLSQLLSNFFKF